MTFNPWVKVDESKNEYFGIADFLSNYRRPSGNYHISRSRKLYILEFRQHIKIGASANPRERINYLKEPSMNRIFVSCHSHHYQDEQSLHKIFEQQRAYSEYFWTSYDEAMEAIANYFPHLLKR